MNKLSIKEVLANLKNWDWDVKDYRMTKKEAETCIKALEMVLDSQYPENPTLQNGA
jgi:hypothetical protein